jgi:hypothetical protein
LFAFYWKPFVLCYEGFANLRLQLGGRQILDKIQINPKNVTVGHYTERIKETDRKEAYEIMMPVQVLTPLKY